MTVLITLTTAGTDSGPFDLYSDLDGYTSAFESAVPKASLLSGYASALVPDYTNIIRVKSNGDCVNYIDIPLPGYTTTTTTTATPLECTEYSADALGFPGNIYYTDCSGTFQELFVETSVIFCAAQGTVTTTGPVISITTGTCLI